MIRVPRVLLASGLFLLLASSLPSRRPRIRSSPSLRLFRSQPGARRARPGALEQGLRIG